MHGLTDDRANSLKTECLLWLTMHENNLFWTTYVSAYTENSPNVMPIFCSWHSSLFWAIFVVGLLCVFSVSLVVDTRYHRKIDYKNSSRVVCRVYSLKLSNCERTMRPKIKYNKKYVLWNLYLPNALHSVCLNRLSCTEVGIYNGANSPNGFLTTAVA